MKNESLCIITAIPENFIGIDLHDNTIETNAPNSSILAIILSASFLSIIACYMFRWWNNITQRHAHRYLNTLGENT